MRVKKKKKKKKKRQQWQSMSLAQWLLFGMDSRYHPATLADRASSQ
jgi:hypothetical protein